MRLINVNTMELESFMGTPPEYAILSHTWEEEEVTFQDFLQPSIATEKKGYSKIEHTCGQARKDHLSYAWVDTCCIDKTSSSELSEAINSMYAWYASAKKAYAFLADLAPESPADADSLANCRWFTRGWTLQELIAPPNVSFFDSSWILRGSKISMIRTLATVTDIEQSVLKDASILPSIPVARRMSWAANRITTRVEDIAYCLLGIFDVNIPLLYGENEKAFIRLQEAIMKEVNDLTLFAWRSYDEPREHHRGIFARCPQEFADAGKITFNSQASFSEDFLLTNKGVRIDAGLAEEHDVLSLDCFIPLDGGGVFKHQLGIYLQMHGSGVYARVKPWRFARSSHMWRPGKFSAIYISKVLSKSLTLSLSAGELYRGAFNFGRGFVSQHFQVMWTEPKNLWDAKWNMFLTQGMPAFTGAVFFSPAKQPGALMLKDPFLLVCGISPRTRKPWVMLSSGTHNADVFSAARDLPRLSELARERCQARDMEMMDLFGNYKIKVTVSLSQITFQGVLVHSIDLDYIQPHQVDSDPEDIGTLFDPYVRNA